MTAAALFQSILASMPEIVVVTGACVLLSWDSWCGRGRNI